jgi:hypothetical protein
MDLAVFSVIWIFAFMFVLSTTSVAEDPFAGTWRLNVSPGMGPIKSYILRIERQDNGQSGIFDIVDANGKAFHGEFNARFDGKDYPVTGAPDTDMVSLNRFDTSTLDYLWKKDGKETESWRAVVAGDGKTLNISIKIRNPQGPDVALVSVFNKQQGDCANNTQLSPT